MRARCRNAAWPAAAFASSPFHASSAAACSARPYENDSCHGCGPELVDRVEVGGRLLVALTARQEHDARAPPPGTTSRKHAIVASRDLLGRRPARRVHFLPGITMFGFSSMPSSSTRCAIERVEHRVQRGGRDRRATLDRVVAVHQHFGLDDRDDALFLAQRRVAGERVRVHVDAVLRRDAVADVDHRAPLREPRAELAVLDEPRAQTVEPVGHELVRRLRQRRRALVDLDARDDARRLRARARAGDRRRPAGGSSRRRGSRR